MLGKGGMGEVQLAFDTRMKRKVAIKRMLVDGASNRTAVSRFLTEAQSMAGLDHDNIVDVYDYGRSADGPFLVMQYIDGGSLLDRCREGTLPVEEAVDLICQICDALTMCHDADVIHRDIKPANILMTRDGSPRLTDFGLVKVDTEDGDKTRAGDALGTENFMPPEQWKGSALVDARSDLWALAATLYQMVTGKSPRVIKFTDVPQSLHEVLGKALEDEKDDRYQTAREFRDALRTCLKSVAEPVPEVVVDLSAGECPKCHSRNESDRKFCRGCGQSLRVSCLSCSEQIRVWDKFCPECGCNHVELQRALDCHADAKTYREAYDYPSAMRALESIPEALRTSEMLDDLQQLQSLQDESSELMQTIRNRVQQRDLEGLLELVDRGIELSGDREDLQKLQTQLRDMRDEELAQRDQAYQEADRLLLLGDARKAYQLVCAVKTPELRQSDEQLRSRLKKTIAAEDELLALVKESKADGSGDRRSVFALLQATSDYLSLNPKHEKVRKLQQQVMSRVGGTPEVCKALAKHTGNLWLNGLTSLSVEVAEALATHTDGLSLDGLTSLSVEIAQALAQQKNWLYLNGLTSLSVEVAEALAQHKRLLSLDGLTSLSVEIAQALAQHKDWLYLNGLTSLSVEIAQALAQHKDSLYLKGLTSLSVEIAQALAQHKDSLYLKGLTSLSVEIAQALAQHKDSLYLNGLTSLTPEVAEALAQHKDWLILDGLTSLSVEVAEALATHTDGLSLDGLTSLSVEVAEALAQHKDCLLLNGLTSLSVEVAEALAQHKDWLYLNGLTSLSVEIAQALAQHKDSLLLNGLTSLSVEIAQALAQHKDSLYLDGLTSLSVEVAEALAQHKRLLSLDGLTSLSPEAAHALGQHGDIYQVDKVLERFPQAVAKMFYTARDVDVVLTGYGDNKLAVIKVVRAATGLSLQEAKEVVDGAPKAVKKGISKEAAEKLKEDIESVGGSVEIKAKMFDTAQEAGPAEVAEEQTGFDVVLTGYGDEKFAVSRVVRDATGLSLKEVLFDSLGSTVVGWSPKAVKKGISKEAAEKLKEDIEGVGGSVEIK